MGMPCKHRQGNNCEYTGRLCFGANYDEVAQGYVVDRWKESRCQTYEESGDRLPIMPILSKQEKASEAAPEGEALVKVFYVPEDGDETAVEVEILGSLLKRRFVGRVLVEGIDLTATSDYPEVAALIQETEARAVVTINGEVKAVGEISLPLIKQELVRLGIEEVKDST
ncbi:MAG: hypothetical protein AABX40_02490 [Candidatus Hydrothermarchaeota archaeon]